MLLIEFCRGSIENSCGFELSQLYKYAFLLLCYIEGVIGGTWHIDLRPRPWWHRFGRVGHCVNASFLSHTSYANKCRYVISTQPNLRASQFVHCVLLVLFFNEVNYEYEILLVIHNCIITCVFFVLVFLVNDGKSVTGGPTLFGVCRFI